MVARILLGVRLRRLREERKISRSDAAYTIRASDSKIGRMELGRSPFKERDVADLLTLYGIVDEGERGPLLRLARESAGPGWWHPYGDLISTGTEHYLGLEEAARVIRLYEPQFVPELLQIDDYARAITWLRHPNAFDGDIYRRVDMQMLRQRVFFKDGARTLWAILDEAALRRPWGGPEVLRAQLRHLLDTSALLNVSVQVIPFTAVTTIGPGIAFTQFRFDAPDLPDVVHLDQVTGAYFIDRRDDTEHFSLAMNLLARTALTPEESRVFLAKLLTDI